jgi:5'-methylthioadenosine phosphorylase
VEHPTVAIIGGSDLYHLPSLKNVQIYNVDTPFGNPSSPIQVGELGGQIIAFTNRHGSAKNYSPNQINYRANIYALKSLGVDRIIATSACGSLREDYSPGDLVVPDQLFDFTKTRISSFFEDNFSAHINVANPFCTDFPTQLTTAADLIGAECHFGGTMITIEGPRYSTKGESNTFRSWDMSLIGMTTSPEAFLAREAEICYSPLVHVSEFDVWHPHRENITNQEINDQLLANHSPTEKMIYHIMKNYQSNRTCDCNHALEKAFSSSIDFISEDMLDKYQLLIHKYKKSN